MILSNHEAINSIFSRRLGSFLSIYNTRKVTCESLDSSSCSSSLWLVNSLLFILFSSFRPSHELDCLIVNSRLAASPLVEWESLQSVTFNGFPFFRCCLDSCKIGVEVRSQVTWCSASLPGLHSFCKWIGVRLYALKDKV